MKSLKWRSLLLAASVCTLCAAKVTVLTTETFDDTLHSGKTVFVRFYAPWYDLTKRSHRADGRAPSARATPRLRLWKEAHPSLGGALPRRRVARVGIPTARR